MRVCRQGNGADTQGGWERGVWCRGHNEGMGRDFKKEKHEALNISLLDNGLQNNFLREAGDASLLET